IKKSGDTANIYNNNLTNFKNHGYLFLSDISTGGTQDYDFTVKMQQSADDQYQNLNLNFDLTLGFELLPFPPGPTSTPGPSECATLSPPTNLVASAVSSSVINLTWSAPPETLTHYSISYGPNPGSYLYGAVNIGNVTGFTVSELSSGTAYYFVVYAVSDCTSSGPSNEASATTTGVLGAFVASGPAAGFEVLGAQTENPSTSSTDLGNIQGVETGCSRYWLPLLYLLVLFINLIYYYYRIEKKPKSKTPLLHLLPFFLSVLSYFADKLLLKNACCLVFPAYCSYFWIGCLLSWFVPFFYFRHLAK
ncbi:fibronectin type III domain-containing protein, partial [Patescibacteria group bacterium]|nr:fibronectin type III domain-containing protein [Patescibacteria group bacterium]